MSRYFVIDDQGANWKEKRLFHSHKEIFESFSEYPEYCDLIREGVKPTLALLLDIWEFSVFKYNAKNLLKHDLVPSQFKKE